jgi:hypothetical protein
VLPTLFWVRKCKPMGEAADAVPARNREVAEIASRVNNWIVFFM